MKNKEFKNSIELILNASKGYSFTVRSIFNRCTTRQKLLIKQKLDEYILQVKK